MATGVAERSGDGVIDGTSVGVKVRLGGSVNTEVQLGAGVGVRVSGAVAFVGWTGSVARAIAVWVAAWSSIERT